MNRINFTKIILKMNVSNKEWKKVKVLFENYTHKGLRIEDNPTILDDATTFNTHIEYAIKYRYDKIIKIYEPT